MGVNLAQKNISTFDMLCSDTAQITLTLAASNDVTTNPVDIMLVLDRSGSMNDRTSNAPGAPTKLAALKEAAIAFTQIIANASTSTTPPPDSPVIANSTIGVVSFADTATVNLPLNQTVATIDAAINALTANGLTNHADAFNTAAAALQAGTNNRKIIILITDGLSTAPQPDPVGAADVAAEAARNAGIIIYGIGLGQDASEANLIDWAGDAARVLIAPDTADLLAAFEALAANIVNPAPQNIVVVDTLENEFEIVDPIVPTTPAGITVTATVSNNNRTITWTLSSLGLTEPQVASLSFGIRYTGSVSGTFPVNESIVYDDSTTADPSSVVFISNGTSITVTCDEIVSPDCDFECQTRDIPCCEPFVEINMPSSDTAFEILCDGTLLNVNVRFNNICPNRRLAVGVIVTPIVDGEPQISSYRITSVDTPTVTATATPSCACSDFTVPFELLLPPPENGNSCMTRQVNVRVIAHYLSDSFIPCTTVAVNGNSKK